MSPQSGGFYAGLNVGYGWGELEGAGGAEQDLNGWLGGAQAGYNFSSGGMVFGFEGGIQTANISFEEDLGFGATAEGGHGTFGTVWTRIGADLDGFMPYVTGGLAYGEYFYELDGGPDISDSDWALGWTAGVGVEAMLADNISLKAEYLYLDLGEGTLDLGADLDVDTYAHSARIGINYHF